jgi:hypothetical protein
MAIDEVQKDEQLLGEKLVDIFHGVVGKMLENEIDPREISHAMTFVAAELGFISTEDKLGVISVLLDSISQASSIVANERSEPPKENNDTKKITIVNKTIH